MFRTHSILFCSFYVIAALILKGDEKFSLSADEPIQYDDQNKTLIAEGNASLTSESILLMANLIKWDKKEETIEAYGDIILGYQGYRILAESIIIDLVDGTFTAQNVISGSNPWIIKSKQLELRDSNVTFQESSIIHQYHAHLSPYLEVKKFSWDDNASNISISNISLKVDNYTLGKIPGIDFSTKSKNFDFDLLIGSNEPLGPYGGGRFPLYKKDSHNSHLETISYFERGLYLSPEFNLKKNDPGGFHFYLQSKLGTINDTGTRGLDLKNDEIGSKRYYSRNAIIFNLDRSWHFASKINPQSDSEIFKEFERDSFVNSQWIENFAELTFDSEPVTISLLTDWQVNDYEAQVERKPLILLQSGPKSWWNKNFYDTFIAEYSNISKRNDRGITEIDTNKFDLAYKTSSPQKLGKGFTYTPSATYRWQTFQTGNNGDPTSGFVEINNKVKFEAFSPVPNLGTFFRESPALHLLEINLQYSIIEEISGTNKSNRPLIDEFIIDPNLERSSLIDFQDSDMLEEINVVRVGMHNSILKFDNNSYLDELATLRIYQDAWKEQNNQIDEDLYFLGIFSLKPHRNLNLEYASKISTSSGSNIRDSFSAKIKDGYSGEYNISRLSFLNKPQNLQYTAFNNLNSSTSLFHGLRYNPDTKEIPYWFMGLDWTSPPGWKWSIYVNNYKNLKKENHFSWKFRVGLFNF